MRNHDNMTRRIGTAAACLAVFAAASNALAQGAGGGGGAGGGIQTVLWIIGIAVGAVLLLIVIAIFGQFINLYIQSLFSNARISMVDLIGMRLRKVDLRTIVYSRIRAVKAASTSPPAPSKRTTSPAATCSRSSAP